MHKCQESAQLSKYNPFPIGLLYVFNHVLHISHLVFTHISSRNSSQSSKLHFCSKITI